MTNRILGKIGGRQLISTGTVLISNGQEAILYPFGDDPSYAMKVIFNFAGNQRAGIRSFDVDDILNIEVSRPFEQGIFVSSRDGLNFSSDNDYEYYIRLSGNVYGDENIYTVILTYNVFQESK